MPSVMMEHLRGVYDLNAAALGNLSASYYYTYVPMQLLVGLWVDRFAPRYLLVLGLLSCSLGGFLFACSDNVTIAIVGRLLVGFGSAFAFIGALKLASIWLPTRFAIVTGVVTMLGMLGGLLGDLGLTKLVALQGWRLTCYSLALGGAAAALVIYFILRGACFTYSNKGYAKVLLPNLRDGLLGLLVLIKQPQYWVSCSIGMLMYLPISGFAESWGIQYLIQVQHMPTSLAAFAVAMLFLGYALGAPLVGWIADLYKQRQIPMTVGCTGAAIMLSIVLFVPQLKIQLIYFLMFLVGFFSSAQVLVFAICRDIAPKKLTATAVAFANMIIMLAGASVWLMGFVINFTWHGLSFDGMRLYGSTSYQIAATVIPLGLVMAMFLTFYLREASPSAVAYLTEESQVERL